MNQHLVETLGTVALAVFSTLIGPAAVEYFKVHVIGRKQKDPIKDELEYSFVINEQLEEIRTLMNSDRCWISMYHNGGHYLHSKRSMQKFSIMFESCAPGVSTVSTIFNNIPVSLYPSATREYLENRHIYVPDYTDPNVNVYGLGGGAEATGSISTYSVALFDIATDQCIGALGVDYLEKMALSDSELQLLNHRVQGVAGYLSNFIKSK